MEKSSASASCDVIVVLGVVDFAFVFLFVLGGGECERKLPVVGSRHLLRLHWLRLHLNFHLPLHDCQDPPCQKYSRGRPSRK